MAPVFSSEIWSAVFLHLAPDYSRFHDPKFDGHQVVAAIHANQAALKNCMLVCLEFAELAGKVLYTRPFVVYLGEFVQAVDSTVQSTASALRTPAKQALLEHVQVLHIDDPDDAWIHSAPFVRDLMAKTTRARVAPGDKPRRAARSYRLFSKVMDERRDSRPLAPNMAGVVVGSPRYCGWTGDGFEPPSHCSITTVYMTELHIARHAQTLLERTRGFWCELQGADSTGGLKNISALQLIINKPSPQRRHGGIAIRAWSTSFDIPTIPRTIGGMVNRWVNPGYRFFGGSDTLKVMVRTSDGPPTFGGDVDTLAASINESSVHAHVEIFGLYQTPSLDDWHSFVRGLYTDDKRSRFEASPVVARFKDAGLLAHLKQALPDPPEVVYNKVMEACMRELLDAAKGAFLDRLGPEWEPYLKLGLLEDVPKCPCGLH